MPPKGTILIVDDDVNICQLVTLYLEKEGFDVQIAHRGDVGLRMILESNPALTLLDIMLPEMDGWHVLKAVREHSAAPIIMLTAKGETFDKVLGLELGADDYISKPFDPTEMVARVKAVMRRMQSQEDEPQVISFPDLTIDMDNYVITCCGHQMQLPPKELELLYFIASHPNRVFTREQLLEQVWGYDFFGDSRTVDVHVKRLREKLNAYSDSMSCQIKTVWGVGYKFEVT